MTPGSRRRRLTRRRIAGGSVPYLLIAPIALVLAGILGYPVYYLVRISLERYDLFALAAHHGPYIGLANFRSVLHDSVFWHTLLRSVVFTAVNVGLTMVLGTLLALLLVRVSTWVRLLLTAGLVLVWAMPPVVAVQVWSWMTNSENGILNYALTQLHVGNYFQHNWYETTFSQYSMVASLIVWGAIPFVTITVYAALAQVPHELVEAAEIDGARAWRIFKDVTLPVLMPVLTSSRSRGSWPSRSASKAVRSRIATTTSYGSRALTSASVRVMGWANTSIWPSERTADQSALARETC